MENVSVESLGVEFLLCHFLVTLGKPLNLSEPQFAQPYNKNNTFKDSRANVQKALNHLEPQYYSMV